MWLRPYLADELHLGTGIGIRVIVSVHQCYLHYCALRPQNI
jgi:hypothetical protein